MVNLRLVALWIAALGFPAHFSNASGEARLCNPSVYLRTIFESEPDYFMRRKIAYDRGNVALAASIDESLKQKLYQGEVLEVKTLPRETIDKDFTGDAHVDSHFRAGVTESYFVKIDSGQHFNIKGIFKPEGGLYSSIAAEVTAYEVSERLGLGLVPVTIEREIMIQGKPMRGSLQAWVKHYDGTKYPTKTTEFFDSLIGNNDRKNNLLPGPVAIDHGYAFKYQNVYIDLPPPDVALNFKKLSEAEFRKLLYRLPEDAIERAIQRRREILFIVNHPELNITGRLGLLGAFHKIPQTVRAKARLELINLEKSENDASVSALKILGY